MIPENVQRLLNDLATRICSAHREPNPDCHTCFPRGNVSRGWMVLACIYQERLDKANALLEAIEATPEIQQHLESCKQDVIHQEYMKDLGF